MPQGTKKNNKSDNEVMIIKKSNSAVISTATPGITVGFLLCSLLLFL